MVVKFNMVANSSHYFNFQQRATLVQTVTSATVRLATRYVETSYTTLKVISLLFTHSLYIFS